MRASRVDDTALLTVDDVVLVVAPQACKLSCQRSMHIPPVRSKLRVTETVNSAVSSTREALTTSTGSQKSGSTICRLCSAPSRATWSKRSQRTRRLSSATSSCRAPSSDELRSERGKKFKKAAEAITTCRLGQLLHEPHHFRTVTLHTMTRYDAYDDIIIIIYIFKFSVFIGSERAPDEP